MTVVVVTMSVSQLKLADKNMVSHGINTASLVSFQLKMTELLLMLPWQPDCDGNYVCVINFCPPKVYTSILESIVLKTS